MWHFAASSSAQFSEFNHDRKHVKHTCVVVFGMPRCVMMLLYQSPVDSAKGTAENPVMDLPASACFTNPRCLDFASLCFGVGHILPSFLLFLFMPITKQNKICSVQRTAQFWFVPSLLVHFTFLVAAR